VVNFGLIEEVIKFIETYRDDDEYPDKFEEFTRSV